MKVLEIYPNYCWSIQSENTLALDQLREAVRIAGEQERAMRLAEIEDGKAFLFTGETLQLEFSEEFFDEVIIDEQVSAVKAALLKHRAKRWIKPEGSIRVPEHTPEENLVYVPLRQRLYRLATGRWPQPRLAVGAGA